MTAIWQNDGSGWHLLTPTGFPNEATLHTLVEQAPNLLPLAGSPRLIVLGREVQLGSGRADLIAIEPTGRIAIIEIKLAWNAEARRAVIAQVLAYAAYLWGFDLTALEQDVLYQHLRDRGYEGLAHAVASNDQEGSFDVEAFSVGVAESLKLGHFRLVFVLDEAPEELVRLVNYLETISDQLVIDLITLSAYTVNGSQILVPQRVEAERQRLDLPPSITPLLTLLPRLPVENVGLVSIYNTNGAAYIQFWRSVFERRAPKSLASIDPAITLIRQGNTIREVSDQLLTALTMAYKEAASGAIEV